MANSILDLMQKLGYYQAGGGDVNVPQKLSELGGSFGGFGDAMTNIVNQSLARKKAELEIKAKEQALTQPTEATFPVMTKEQVPVQPTGLPQVQQAQRGVTETKEVAKQLPTDQLLQYMRAREIESSLTESPKEKKKKEFQAFQKIKISPEMAKITGLDVNTDHPYWLVQKKAELAVKTRGSRDIEPGVLKSLLDYYRRKDELFGLNAEEEETRKDIVFTLEKKTPTLGKARKERGAIVEKEAQKKLDFYKSEATPEELHLINGFQGTASEKIKQIEDMMRKSKEGKTATMRLNAAWKALIGK